jgi:hypothetical protein
MRAANKYQGSLSYREAQMSLTMREPIFRDQPCEKNGPHFFLSGEEYCQCRFLALILVPHAVPKEVVHLHLIGQWLARIFKIARSTKDPDLFHELKGIDKTLIAIGEAKKI